MQVRHSVRRWQGPAGSFTRAREACFEVEVLHGVPYVSILQQASGSQWPVLHQEATAAKKGLLGSWALACAA